MSKAEKVTRARSYSAVLMQDEAKEYLSTLPSFQRPLNRGRKFGEVTEYIVENNRIPGVVTIAVVDGVRYVIDGQHRLVAFTDSQVELIYAEIREITFDTFEEAAAEFRRLNSAITKMKPDDILRSEEVSSTVLQYIRKSAPFVGYGNIRRGDNRTVLSMSVLLRVWNESAPVTPSSRQMPAQEIVKTMDMGTARECVRFLGLVNEAWGRDDGDKTLWGALNMTLCMWLYRRIVLGRFSTKSIQVDDAMFKKCLMAVSADGDYAGWLRGRRVCERDRSQCYRRLKDIFAKRLQSELHQRVMLPQPEWAGS
jgi:hypothetical protein